ncbi:MAG: GNAT family N-acetyltransferase [Deltaproteobacteria bacterium]
MSDAHHHSSPIMIVHAPEAGRYEARHGDALAGYAEYRDDGDGLRVFPHTVVDPAYGGRGIAGQLARQALEDTRAAGRRAVPVCSFFVTYMAKHPEFADLVAPG